MPPHKDHLHYERENARQWDTESNISVSTNASRQGLRPNRAASTASAPTHSSNATLSSKTHATRISVPARQGPSQPKAFVPAAASPQSGQANVLPTTNEGRALQQRQGDTCNLGNQRRIQPFALGHHPSTPARLPRNPGWARKADLITTRHAERISKEALKKAEFDALCVTPNSNEPFPVTGYYLWPRDCGDPMSLLDPTLKIFDDLRRTYKVHIDWNDKMRCLRINCDARNAEQNVSDVIQGIKVLQRDAQAAVNSASTKYFVVAPTADAMRSIVRPKETETREDSANLVVTRIELAGQHLPTPKLLEWKDRFRQRNTDNYKVFRKDLIDRTIPLGDLRSWMRMRVHLGHVNLSQYHNDFFTGKYTFEKFENMMKNSRVTTGGTFDRKMHAPIAINLIEIIAGREQDFCPRKSTTPTLSDVLSAPTHTEIIFVSTPDGRKYRLEAEIESAYVADKGAKGKYQIGTTRLFATDRRNKRVELTTVDIERGIDWILEISQDSEIDPIPSILQDYTPASLDSKSEELVDPLGVPFPAIALKAPVGFEVTSVVMRSTFQYMFIHTSNIIEITIYRDWDGYNTKRAPLMQASVSMFNPDWDSEMESVKKHTEPRNWDPQLQNFFGKDGVGHINTGLQGLIHEIREVQGLLCRAATNSIKPEQASAESGAITEPVDDSFDDLYDA